MADDRNSVAIRRARAVANVMDRAIGIPGTGIRFGLDSIIGIIPGVGDAIGVALSGYIVMLAARAGVSKAVLTRMISNVVIDGVVGIVPLAGDIFDMAWKANTRNADLLEQELGASAPAPLSRGVGGIGWGMIIGALILAALLVFVSATFLWRLFSST